MKIYKIKTSLQTFTIVSLLSSAVTSYADDTEVFYPADIGNPNLLFVLDNSGSMNWDEAGNEPTTGEWVWNRRRGWTWVVTTNPAFSAPSRLTMLRNSLSTVLTSTMSAESKVNIGVMRYGPGVNYISTGGGSSSIEYNYTTQNIRTHNVSGVSFPVTDIYANANTVIETSADATPLFPNPGTIPAAGVSVGTYVNSIVANWAASGGTPITDALYEAALYYRGEKVHYGQSTPSSIVGAHPSTYSGNAITADITGGATPRNNATAPNYTSPITNTCQSNYIVLMSDGSPTYYYSDGVRTQTHDGSTVDWDKNRGPFAEDMQGNSGYSDLASDMTDGCIDAPDGFTSGKCGPEITRHLADNDNVSNKDVDAINGLDSIQRVYTYTVGLGVAEGSTTEDYLKRLETIDDYTTDDGIDVNGYFPASSEADLVSAFTQIIDFVADPSGTLASPGYSVNVKSGLEHEDDIYIPVFDRKNTSRWSGNLKKFNLVDVNGKRKIQGKNNKDAVNEYGGFTDDAWDEWSGSTSADGRDIDSGGVASLLASPGSRNLYSNLSGDNNVLLSANNNKITRANFALLTDADLGVEPSTDDADYRKKLASFIRGFTDGDPTATARKHMGDMLHSEPLVVTYDAGSGSVGETGYVAKTQYIFAGTNEGYLHVFDTATGIEQFAFMPKELLKNIDPQFLNAGTEKDHKYGVDGSLTFWEDPADQEKYIYFGLRRGGSSYYALNVTSITAPKLEWSIINTTSNPTAGSGTTHTTMGQSWSSPYLANVGVGSNSTKTPALIFTGGYDEVEDRDDSSGNLIDSETAVTTTKGNDVFIFNAKTGSYIWSLKNSNATTTDLISSVPGGARILDTNYNGLIDRMYFADTGGFVWRLDLGEELTTSGETDSELYKFAELGASNTRKFYNEPEVSAMKLKGKTVYLVSIGSGFRAHPMDREIDDKFFMLLDKTPFSSRVDSNDDPVDAITIAATDLAVIDITSSSVSQTGSIQDDGIDGWVVNLPTKGEKVLSTAVTLDGVMTFTTLEPALVYDSNFPDVDICASPTTDGLLYGINILTGEAGLDLSGDGVITDADISTKVSEGEIPGKPQQVVGGFELEATYETDGVTLTGNKSCTHPVDVRVGKKLSQVTGYDTCRLESVYWSDPVTDQ